MQWFDRPESGAQRLRKEPQLDQWEKAGHPAMIRLQDYLDDTEALIAPSRAGLEGPWTLRLDIGRPADRPLLDKADLDNYATPLARRVGNENLVSVWCTKDHGDASFIRVEQAREVPAPQDGVVIAAPTASKDSAGHLYHRQIHAAIADLVPFPGDRPVRLELAFVVPTGWNWINFWKPTIDGLVHLLGHSGSAKPFDPLDGRITELGLHLTPDPAARNVTVGITASCG